MAGKLFYPNFALGLKPGLITGLPVSGSMSIVFFNAFAVASTTTLVASNVILVSVGLLGSTNDSIFCRISPAVSVGSFAVEMSVLIDSSVSGIALASSGFFLLSMNSCAKKSNDCDGSLLIVIFLSD